MARGTETAWLHRQSRPDRHTDSDRREGLRKPQQDLGLGGKTFTTGKDAGFVPGHPEVLAGRAYEMLEAAVYAAIGEVRTLYVVLAGPLAWAWCRGTNPR